MKRSRGSRWVLWATSLILIGLAILFTALVSPLGIFLVLIVIMAVFQAGRANRGGPRNYPDIPI